MEEYNTKACSQCGNIYPATTDYFHSCGPKHKYALHTECKECAKKYRDSHAQKRSEYQKQYRALHYDELQEKARIKNRRTSEQNIARAKRWKENNPDQYRANIRKAQAKRRAKKANLPNELIDLEKLFQLQKGKCWYCGIDLESYEIEHRVPISRGGGHTAGNIVLACRHCNRTKSAKLPDEFCGRLL